MNSEDLLVLGTLFLLVMVCWWANWLAIAALRKLTATLDPRLLPTGLCPNCSYDRTGKHADERCSECGLPYGSARSARMLVNPWLAYAPTLCGPALLAYLAAVTSKTPIEAFVFLPTITLPFVLISVQLHFSAITRHTAGAVAVALVASSACLAPSLPAFRRLFIELAAPMPYDDESTFQLAVISLGIALGISTASAWATALLVWIYNLWAKRRPALLPHS